MRDFQIQLPQPVCTALDALHQAGYPAYIVGGCVRDALRGTAPHDWDCTTAAHPEQIAACFPDYHVIETGIQHGTVTVVIDRMPIEITTYRIDGAYADHRRPDSVTFTDTLHDDLARRDFTVNAMAYHPEQGLIDPFGGASDLQRGVISCVGSPQARFDEDGLRILRALRFASVLDFQIVPETAQAIHRQRMLLQHISAERIYAEMTKLLCGIGAERVLSEYADVLFTVLPELKPMEHFEQHNPYHAYDVYIHTMKVLSACPPEPVLRWAALLHDSGKPHCYTEDARGGHFYGHADISAEIAERAMYALKTDRKTHDRVRLLVQHHDTVFNGTDQQLKRLVRRFGYEAAAELLLLHRADETAKTESIRAARTAEADRLLERLHALQAADACMSLKHLAIGGDALLALGIPQGKAVGACLNALLERVIDEQIPNTQEALCAAAKQWMHSADD